MRGLSPGGGLRHGESREIGKRTYACADRTGTFFASASYTAMKTAKEEEAYG